MDDAEAADEGVLSRIFQAVAADAARFRSTIGGRPQRPERTYAQALAAFEAPAPETGEPAETVIRDLQERAAPGLHATTGPRFFGWVIGASHPVGVAADWLAAAWGQNAGNHTAAPSAAAAEAVSARWLLDFLDLPRESSVGFVTGATVANVVCLAAARGEVLRRSGWDVERDGLFGAPPIHVLIGADAHTTVFSALQFLGLGHGRVIRIPADDQGRMQPDALRTALASCRGPTIVITQAGQINTGAFDDHAAIVRLAQDQGAWVHVDGAFGLWARACPPLAHLGEGIELADSWATDGHKWLQIPYDCGYAIVRNAEAHRRSMIIAASYLPGAGGDERDPSHYVPELSRRARGFATWAMLSHLGRQGIARMVERHCAMARRLAGLLGREPGITILNDVVLNQVIVRFGADEPSPAGDDLTLRTIRRIQDDGTLFAGGARWRGLWVMRMSVISYGTTRSDIERAAGAIIGAWRRIRPSS
ncbi:pyridoxal phosphate-dependent decarboxylase family protein [Microvirga pudoricolor]|uniref:pyridoxal phosphate-dependent decarboxylase family protein n=1 Tax=Microvirga pudoricolor TaxID=2778729 RepID=UPI0019513EF6|nr:aspartate aminotransferase family protein [Microvirga pudoricolor]MBM6595453.1 aspartate aminotransferase family protein [Microvirga pudoricolor]